jgi:hypothetical protein
MHDTISIQGRISISAFASLTRAYIKEGHSIRTKSDVLWRAVEQLSLMYAKKHNTPAFASIPDALEFMESIGMSLGTNPRAQRTIMQALADESHFLEVGEVAAARNMPIAQIGSGNRQPSERELLMEKFTDYMKKGIIENTTTFEQFCIDQKDVERKIINIKTGVANTGRSFVSDASTPRTAEEQAAIDAAEKQKQDEAMKTMMAQLMKGTGGEIDG